MMRSTLLIGGLCAAALAGACTDEAPGPSLLVAPFPSPAACGVCTPATFSVALPLPASTPAPVPSQSPRPGAILLDAAIGPDEELEQSLMLAAALVPEGRACLTSGGYLAPADALVRTTDRASLAVRCDCGGAP